MEPILVTLTMLLKTGAVVLACFISNVAANHPHFQCAEKAPFQVNDWFEWANCEWSMEHPQKCKPNEPQRMMTCQVVCEETEPRQPAKNKTVVQMCELAKIDLTFLIDGSGSVGSSHFDMTKEFLKDVITHLDVSVDSTHVNIIQYSHYYDAVVLNATSKANLLQTVNDIKFHDGSTTRTGGAISFAAQVVFTPQVSRQNVTHVFVVMTDGKAQDDFATPIAALHAMGIDTIAVGVGSGVDMSELAAIASEPANVHSSPDFASLKKLQEQLTEEICKFVTI